MSFSEKQPTDTDQNIDENTCCCNEVVEPDAVEPAAATAADEDIVILKEKLTEQTKLSEEYFNSLARVQADYDNFKRRTRQEKEDFFKYASEQLMVALLPVLDNFDRAMAAEGGDVEDFKAGVEMIHRQLWDVLRDEGLVSVPTVGEMFDPMVHEAVMQEASDEYQENTVIAEFQRGYLLKEKLIRVAMVKVSN
ncbi:MAG: nucleotide exchange factor GrpE [Peptococcaceae bacterium]|nr:nucleotide exchange factor GrpE [Peptococcaceae bacterium]